MLISHDLGQVEAICDRAIWLDGGRMQRQGEPEPVVQAYRTEVMAETARRTPPDAPEAMTAGGVRLRMGENRHGSLELEISSMHLLDGAGNETEVIISGAPLTFEIALRTPGDPVDTQLSVSLTHGDGTLCLEASTAANAAEPVRVAGDLIVALDLDRLDLAPGGYTISVGAWHPSWNYAFDYHQNAYALRVGGSTAQGVLSPPMRWTLREG